jgi:hypothetical protein
VQQQQQQQPKPVSPLMQQHQPKPVSPFMQQQQHQIAGALQDARVPSPFATRGPEAVVATEGMVGALGPAAAAAGGPRRTGCPRCEGPHLDGYVTCPSPSRSGAFDCTHEVSILVHGFFVLPYTIYPALFSDLFR